MSGIPSAAASQLQDISGKLDSKQRDQQSPSYHVDHVHSRNENRDSSSNVTLASKSGVYVAKGFPIILVEPLRCVRTVSRQRSLLPPPHRTTPWQPSKPSLLSTLGACNSSISGKTTICHCACLCPPRGKEAFLLSISSSQEPAPRPLTAPGLRFAYHRYPGGTGLVSFLPCQCLNLGTTGGDLLGIPDIPSLFFWRHYQPKRPSTRSRDSPHATTHHYRSLRSTLATLPLLYLLTTDFSSTPPSPDLCAT